MEFKEFKGPFRAEAVASLPQKSKNAIVGSRGREIVSSEAPEVGGTGEGLSPLELLMASLASCEVFMFKMIAAKILGPEKSEEIEVKASAKGEFELGRGLTRAFIRYEVSGVSREEAERIIGMVRELCPVYNTLKAAAEVREELVVR